MLPGKLKMFLSVLVSAGVIILYVKRIEHAVECGYALYKCNYDDYKAENWQFNPYILTDKR